ncbi:MAG: hypothetical protein J6Y20_05020 [Lachnospiraceae bacterium]|nr:hypothetical protein [Kiritimatiellia bacterium]MBP5461469.1 hypothetical protein [Lachnospiraceae bacterium]
MDRKEAIEVVRKKVDYYEADKRLKAALEALIPELAESEDEKTLEFMRDHFYNLVKLQDENERMYTRCLVYLDKLKGQKAIQDSVVVVAANRPMISKFEAGKAAVLNNPEEYGLRTINKWAGSKRGLPPGSRTMFPIKGDDDNDLDLALDILQRTLGQVDGYQSDDGILEHKKAIMAVTDAMNAKPAEWSDDDEKQLNWFYRLLDFIGKEFPSTWGQNHKGGKEWLKSIRPQPQWKPSKEQMSSLKTAIDYYKDRTHDEIVCPYLESLYDDLKKL